MRRFLLLLLIFLSLGFNVAAQIPTSGPRFAACDLCGYCPPNQAPQSWEACRTCLYPSASTDPAAMDTLKIDPTTKLPPVPAPGKQYTFLGCLGAVSSFSQEGAAGGVVQSLLNVVFSLSGGLAFLYLLYGSFIVITSQSDPERLNYGRRVITGSIIGLVFTLGSVFVVNLIAADILKIPGFGTP